METHAHINEFINETNDSLSSIEYGFSLLKKHKDVKDNLDLISRSWHSIKGSASFFNMPKLLNIVHIAEDVIRDIKEGKLNLSDQVYNFIEDCIEAVQDILSHYCLSKCEPEYSYDYLLVHKSQIYKDMSSLIAAKPQIEGDYEYEAETTVTVEKSRLDKLLVHTSRAVLARNQLVSNMTANEMNIRNPIYHLDQALTDLQDSLIYARKKDIAKAFERLSKVVRYSCRKLNKFANINFKGQNTQVDRYIIEKITPALIQIVRNSCAHGIEKPKDRQAAGKAVHGNILIETYCENGYVTIVVKDDGAGFDTKAIAQKAISLGIATSKDFSKKTDIQIIDYIYDSSLSTKDKADIISGRGSGLDIARNQIEKLGGTIVSKNRSEGRGAKTIITIPQTLAQIKAFIFSAGNEKLAISNDIIIDVLDNYSYSNSRDFIKYKDKNLPCVNIANALDMFCDKGKYCLILNYRMSIFAVIVDEICHIENTVNISLPKPMLHNKIFSGCVTMSNGQASLLLNPEYIISKLPRPASKDSISQNGGYKQIVVADASNNTYAIDMSRVKKILRLRPSEIKTENDNYSILYNKRIIKLFVLGEPYNFHNDRFVKIVLTMTRDKSVVIGLIVKDMAFDNRSIISSATDIKKRSGSFSKNIENEKKIELSDSNIQVISRDILIIDNSTFFRNMMFQDLVSNGFKVSCVGNIDGAVKLYDKGLDFGAVLCDMQLGIDELQKFNNWLDSDNIRWKNITKIATSANASAKNINLGRDMGFDSFVAKFDKVKMHNILNHAIER